MKIAHIIFWMVIRSFYTQPETKSIRFTYTHTSHTMCTVFCCWIGQCNLKAARSLCICLFFSLSLFPYFVSAVILFSFLCCWWNITQNVSFRSDVQRLWIQNESVGDFKENIGIFILCLQKEWQMNTRFRTCCVLPIAFILFVTNLHLRLCL